MVSWMEQEAVGVSVEVFEVFSRTVLRSVLLS